MFGLFKKDPVKKLQKQYHDKLEEAMHAQRNGDIRSYSALSTEADKLLKAIENIKSTAHFGE